MKSYTITEEQIKELENGFTLPKLKEWFPEVFKTKLEVGKWYKRDKFKNALVFCKEIKNEGFWGFGFSNSCEWLNNYFADNYFSDVTLATKEEVEQALIKEAERRGFKEGVEFLSPNSKIKNKCNGSFRFDEELNVLYSNGIAVFNKGLWAEIIEDKKEMTIEEIEKQLGYSIKIVKDETK